jgi:hypothetical protein
MRNGLELREAHKSARRLKPKQIPSSWPTSGPEDGPKTKPISGLGWAGLGWAGLGFGLYGLYGLYGLCGGLAYLCMPTVAPKNYLRS